MTQRAEGGFHEQMANGVIGRWLNTVGHGMEG